MPKGVHFRLLNTGGNKPMGWPPPMPPCNCSDHNSITPCDCAGPGGLPILIK